MDECMSTDTERLRYASFLTLLIVCALLLAARMVYLYLADPQQFPISTVKVAASYRHVTRKQLESVLSEYSNNSFSGKVACSRLESIFDDCRRTIV